MKCRRSTAMILSMVVLSAGLCACEADDSLPTRPRTAANPLAPDSNAQNNAEKRELEKPARNMPTGGAEFPGQSRADFDTDARVLTLQAGGGGGAGAGGGAGGAGAAGAPGGIGGTSGGTVGNGVTGAPGNPAAVPTPGFIGNTAGSTVGPSVGGVPNSVGLVAPTTVNQSPLSFLGYTGPSGFNAFGHSVGPQTVYGQGNFGGVFPVIPENPGTIPMPGIVMTPSGDWAMDASWGQGLVLQNYPHRDWPLSTIIYPSGSIFNNPTYYIHIGDHLPALPTTGVYEGDVLSDIYEVPWFMVNTAALPVLMALEPPLAKRETVRPSLDPNFRGYVPDGPSVPVPQPGRLEWNYSFLNPDWTVKEPGSSAATAPEESSPATAPAPAPATMPGG